MPLSSGTRLGAYEIVAGIGAGGMGEVYRARDTRLNRQVAIKVLPEGFAADPERRARFEREAQTLAALNHPHIAQIHGVEENGGTLALVMEFVDGEDLAERLRRGPIPLEEALPIARQIADALEAAHERGVIHRDLKPANVKITPEGTVKVLDFGLAKAMQGALEGTSGASRGVPPKALAESPTFTSPAITHMGVILGTAAYMAPEQAKGKPVDRRADIWALGVVLFEMLSGRPLYEGETVAETIAQVITQPANLDALPPATPPAVRRIVRRCLEKDPRNRFHSAGDVRIEIDEYLAAPNEPLGAAPAAAPRSRALTILPWGIAAALALLLAFAILKPFGRSSAPGVASMRVDMRLDESHRLHVDDNVDSAVAVISPDGQTLAYLGMQNTTRRIYVRRLDSPDSTALAGTEGAIGHFFSPDSRWIGFFTGGMLKKIAVTGGAALSIAPARDARGGAWGDGDTIVYTPSTTDGLYRVSASGGEPEPITTRAGTERTHRWPAMLPGGEAALFMVQQHDGSYDDGTIEAVRLDTKERKILVRGGTFPRYLASGHLTYVRENTLFSAPFDADRLELTGTPQPVLSPVLSSRGVGAGVGDGAAQIAFSDAGTVVLIEGESAGGQSRLTVVDRTGKIVQTIPEPQLFRSPQFSPDGSRIAVQLSDGKVEHVHVMEVDRPSVMTRITFDGNVSGSPVWSPDGRRIAYASDREPPGLNIFMTRSDGGGQPEALTSGPHITVPASFSSDGTRLAAMQQPQASETAMDIVVMSLPGKAVQPFVATRAEEVLPAFSPDGKWIAYQSDESGVPEVYIHPYPGPGGRWQISNGGGVNPRWTKGGRELVYLSGLTTMSAVEITVERDAIRHGAEQKLFEMTFAHPPNASWFDVNADGSRFVVLTLDEQQLSSGFTHVTLITNFFERIRRAAER